MACSWSAIGPFTVLRVLLVARLVQPYRHIEVNVPHHHSGIAETRTADNRECHQRGLARSRGDGKHTAPRPYCSRTSWSRRMTRTSPRRRSSHPLRQRDRSEDHRGDGYRAVSPLARGERTRLHSNRTQEARGPRAGNLPPARACARVLSAEALAALQSV